MPGVSQVFWVESWVQGSGQGLPKSAGPRGGPTDAVEDISAVQGASQAFQAEGQACSGDLCISSMPGHFKATFLDDCRTLLSRKEMQELRRLQNFALMLGRIENPPSRKKRHRETIWQFVNVKSI